MTTFLTIAALMTAIALGFILPTLLGKQRGGTTQNPRDQVNLAVLRDQFRELDADLAVGTIDEVAFASARHELEQRVAEDVQPNMPLHAATTGLRLQAIALGLVVMLGAAGLYSYLGTPLGIDLAQAIAPGEKSHAMSQKDTATMVERLAQQLKTQPTNAEGWLMLARSYTAMGRFVEASSAYAHLLTLVPPGAEIDANILTAYADALGMAHGKNLQGEPEKLLVRALAVDPNNTMALALMGTVAFERRDYVAAISDWQKILTLAPADSDMARMVTGNIKEAQAIVAGNPSSPSKASEVPVAVAAPVAGTPSANTPANQVAGTVELDPTLRAQVAETDTVFIFARAVQGPRFPLAVLRKQVKDLPLSFVLDDSMSMMPEAKLSGFPMVVVGARISKTGSATPSAGDLEGIVAPVALGSNGLKIRIGTRRS